MSEGQHDIQCPVSPYLVCAQSASAIDFYKAAFGAEQMVRLNHADGSVMHATLKIKGGIIMVSEENKEWGMLGPKALGGTPVTIHLEVPDADAVFAQAVEAGAEVAMPMDDAFWGARFGMVMDPFGHKWSIATTTKHMTEEEMQAAAANISPECG